MKRYEKMSKEEIIKILDSTIECDDCPVGTAKCLVMGQIGCFKTKEKWLNGVVMADERAVQF